MRQITLLKFDKLNKDVEFEKNNQSWCKVLRKRAKDAIAGRDVCIAPYINGASLDYYNSCLTQLLMYK